MFHLKETTSTPMTWIRTRRSSLPKDAWIPTSSTALCLAQALLHGIAADASAVLNAASAAAAGDGGDGNGPGMVVVAAAVVHFLCCSLDL